VPDGWLRARAKIQTLPTQVHTGVVLNGGGHKKKRGTCVAVQRGLSLPPPS